MISHLCLADCGVNVESLSSINKYNRKRSYKRASPSAHSLHMGAALFTELFHSSTWHPMISSTRCEKQDTDLSQPICKSWAKYENSYSNCSTGAYEQLCSFCLLPQFNRIWMKINCSHDITSLHVFSRHQMTKRNTIVKKNQKEIWWNSSSSSAHVLCIGAATISWSIKCRQLLRGNWEESTSSGFCIDVWKRCQSAFVRASKWSQARTNC